MKFNSFLAALVGVQTVAAWEVVYLVNSRKGNDISSGMAYYGEGHSPANGARPDDYTDIRHGSNIQWEGLSLKGTFSSGVGFTSNINSDAASKEINSWVGTGTNGYKNFNCYKSWATGASPSILYQVDGWDVYSIYFCRA
ncbi:myroilysin precursor [Fusarium beomiforme]|uniref:Myroilysin n=1 Tax=Fusarium beomiforme TaxID=44412 RepID=A0A9P5AJF0_9HYPO|nr:myroilysin precursor [Fusarium beomiforme]